MSRSRELESESRSIFSVLLFILLAKYNTYLQLNYYVIYGFFIVYSILYISLENY